MHRRPNQRCARFLLQATNEKATTREFYSSCRLLPEQAPNHGTRTPARLRLWLLRARRQAAAERFSCDSAIHCVSPARRQLLMKQHCILSLLTLARAREHRVQGRSFTFSLLIAEVAMNPSEIAH
eukprot:767193-Hanusia_phi.AAC.6